MTKEELAALINGCEIGNEITPAMTQAARESGLVVCFGYSDDAVEFRGAIRDEIGAFNGATLRVSADGVLCDFAQVEHTPRDCSKWLRQQAESRIIKAVWSDTTDKPCWTFETDIPCARFNVLEDGEVFCVGIVFELSELKPKESA